MASTSWPSSARNREACRPPSTRSATAETTSQDRALVHATYMSRRSSASRSAWVSPRSSPRGPSSATRRRSERSRTSGHWPSWTEATTTSSHSRPLARWALSSRTWSRSDSWAPRTSWGSRSALISSRNAAMPTSPRRCAGSRLANSNRATTASRSRWADAAAVYPPPGRSAAERSRSGQSVEAPDRPQDLADHPARSIAARAAATDLATRAKADSAERGMSADADGSSPRARAAVSSASEDSRRSEPLRLEGASPATGPRAAP